LQIIRLGLVAWGLLALLGCGGGGGAGGIGGGISEPAGANAAPDSLDGRIRVYDVTGAPIEGAVVTITASGVTFQATTSATGSARFEDVPTGLADISVSAAGFDSKAFELETGPEPEPWLVEVTLDATGAWAIGRAIVLGTDMVERTADGGAMTFSVDVAVIGENSTALEMLTSSDFSLVSIDCGWGGPRDCASDAAGNATPNFGHDGPPEAFGLQPPSARHAYVVGVLVERSEAVTDWYARAPALSSFFAQLGGNDVANLASVQTENGSATLEVLGPFTSDGSTYFDAIDQLAYPAGSPPPLLEAILESIQRVADAEGFGIPGAERTVLVLTGQGMTVPEVDAATAVARKAGVRISTINSGYGLPEIAVRTGGFVADVSDPRQWAMVFGAMDQLLAGTLPYYRMQFRLKGSPGTFVTGGNAKIRLRITVPASMPNRGVWTTFDVAVQ
jgi:hypothetical protein